MSLGIAAEFFLFFFLGEQVRVFTFLIGREVGDLWQTRWMACSNKGVCGFMRSVFSLAVCLPHHNQAVFVHL